MPIDTLKAAKRLQEEDTFTSEQAERIAEILSDMDVASATKEDLTEMEGRLNSRIVETADRLDTRIDDSESHLKNHVETMVDAAEERIVRRLSIRFYTAMTVLAVLLAIITYLVG